jgi:hypothetical protein
MWITDCVPGELREAAHVVEPTGIPRRMSSWTMSVLRVIDTAGREMTAT